MHESDQDNGLLQNLLRHTIENDCEADDFAIIALPLIILQIFMVLA